MRSIVYPDSGHTTTKAQEQGISSPRKRYPVEVLTPDEVAAVIGQLSTTSFTGVRNRAVFTLMYRSGLRVGEIVALKPADLNQSKRSIRVLHGKGDKASTRFWHPSADDALARWIERRQAFLRLPTRAHPLFCTVHGTALATVYLRNLARRLGREAGVTKRVHPHAFRHTYAVELDDAGVPIRTISWLLGHEHVSTTAIYLNHITNRQAGAALEAIELPELQ